MALIPQNDVPQFSHQGTLDYTALAKVPVTFTLETLVRYSKAGVHTSTVGFGRIICSSIVIPAHIEKSILEHIDKLPRTALYGKVAWFGFGLRHVLQDLTENEGGVSCFALCACLSQSYESFFSAQVLRALCKMSCPDIPSYNLPGIQSWQPLIKICAGAFSSTKFPHLVDGFQRNLCPPTDAGVTLYGATDPEALAKALMLLAQISTRRLECCTFSGGIDCAWLAAFAEFTLGFSVDINNPERGYHYQSRSGSRTPTGEAQITILQGVPSTANIMLTRKCFCLPSGKELIREPTIDSGIQQFCIRSPWTTILRDAFGTSIEEMLCEPSVARLLVRIARQPERHWPSQSYPINPNYIPYGDDLVRFTAWRLPELRPCLEAIQPWSAIEDSEEQMALDRRALDVACARLGCPLHDSIDCFLPRILLWYTRILSMVQVQELLPTPSGLLRLSSYWRTRTLLESWGLVKTALLLFSGTDKLCPYVDPGTSGKTSLAFAAEGVCCWYGLLADVKSPPASASRVYIAPGYIEYEGSLFEKIQGLGIPDRHWSKHQFESHRAFELLIQEKQSGDLHAAYKTQIGSSGTAWAFQISAVINTIQHEPSHSARLRETWPPFECGECGRFAIPHYALWDDQNLDSQTHCKMEEDSNRTSKCQPARDSFILAVLHIRYGYATSLWVYKSSIRCWDIPGFGFEQLYTGIGLGSVSPNEYVRSWIEPLSDCPRCIMSSALVIMSNRPYIWDSRECGTSRTIHSRISVYCNEQDATITEGELRFIGCEKNQRQNLQSGRTGACEGDGDDDGDDDDSVVEEG